MNRVRVSLGDKPDQYGMILCECIGAKYLVIICIDIQTESEPKQMNN